MTGPAVLLLLGIIALLHEADLASWNLFFPLLLILIGVLKLAERAALAAAGDEALYPGGSRRIRVGIQGGAPYPYTGGVESGRGVAAGTGAAGISRSFLRHRRTLERTLREDNHEQRTSEHTSGRRAAPV